MKDKKTRVIYLLKYLNEVSDENNTVSTKDILDHLNGVGYNVHRTTLAEDLQLLEDYGIDVIKIKSSPNKYFIGARDFELAELKLLVDAVQSSKLITKTKSNQLVDKLAKLTNNHKAKQLRREVHIENRIKPENEHIYYIIDIIHSAINNKKKLAFKYFDYSIEKKKTYKHDGYSYDFSPYTLFWNNDHYYVIGYSDKHDKIATFRVDRIDEPAILECDCVEKPHGYNPDDYAKEVFSMFDGEESLVTLKCEKSLMNVIVDRFGENVDTQVIDEDNFKAEVKVSVSPTFYGWVFQFGGRVRITSPTEVKNKYIDTIKYILENEDC